MASPFRSGAPALALCACVCLGVMSPAGCGSSSSGEAAQSDASADGTSGSSSGSGDDSGSGSSSGSGGSSGGDAAADASRDAATDARDDAADSSGVPIVPAFYVSPSGKDTNPGTLAQPFLTLGRAQTAMQKSASIKTTYVRAGTYPLTASTATSNCDYGMGSSAIDLGAADAGETWSYYPPDGIGTAILDGGSTSTTTGVACAFAASNAPKLTFTGLQFQHLQYSGIWASTSSNLTASDNTIHDLTVGIFNIGGIALHGSSGATVKNNYIHDVAYMGIGAWGGGTGQSMSNGTITGNVVIDSCTAAAQPGGNDMDGGDCGAIYLWDNGHTSTNDVVTNNYVRDVNISSNGAGDYTGCCATGIYLDDGMSNATVSGNVVTGITSQCFQIHGGNDNTIEDNLCDLNVAKYQRIMNYQWDSLMLQMTGNSFVDNVIVAGTTSAGGGYSDSGTPTPPTIKDNAYYNYVGTSVNSSGSNGSDANPTYENPDVSCWDPTIAASSPVFAAPVSFKKLVGGWGPPGFVMPKTGTPPSWPHGC